MRAWIVFLLYVVWVGGTIARVRARRRSGAVKNFGHPFLDQFLLLGSGLLLAGLLVGATFALGGKHFRSHGGRIVGYSILLAGGGLLTWLCNSLLRHLKR